MKAKTMAGFHAILFLERSDDAFWSADGPDGIYGQLSPVSSAEHNRVRAILAKSPQEGG